MTLREFLREILAGEGSIDDEVMMLTPDQQLVDIDEVRCSSRDALVLIKAVVVE
jgi:hypothetical protein